MNILIVEDDFISRQVLKVYLEPYGKCDIAVNGKEAVEAFKLYLEDDPYNLICLDIMMPEMDGQEVLKQIRQIEAEREIHGYDGVKIIMTTALDTPKSIIEAFHSQCEAYLTKPIEKARLLDEIKNLGLLD